MDIGEILTKITSLPAVDVPADDASQFKRKRDDNGHSSRSKKSASEMNAAEQERILQMVENEPEAEALNETSLKKTILQFEKRVYKNQEMRIKYPDMPEKFMESEVELNDTIQEMHVIATAPDLYHILIELNAVQSLLQLLNHDNTDISIAVVDLLQEMTDVDTLTESEDGANVLIDALLQGQIIALLIQNMERLDETVREEADGVHNSLAIVENMTELRPEICIESSTTGLMQFLFKRLKAKLPFDANKLYCSEILAILLQDHPENHGTLGEIEGIDLLLQQLATFKRHDPNSAEEIELMENLFNCLCSSLMLPANRDRFLKGEGLQLMNLMLREKKMSRCSAIKVLNHAMSGKEGIDNCQKFVDILGLRSIFPLFMKTPKPSKKTGLNLQEVEEHVISVVGAMVKNCSGAQEQRLYSKFVENDHEKVDRLVELHFKYLEKVRMADLKIEKEKQDLKFFGGTADEDMEEQWYLQRLECGLFTLQLVDFIMVSVSVNGPPGAKQRVLQILSMRGGSTKNIRSIMREYAGNIGEADDPNSREEQERILLLLEKFAS
ncbi:hypothetical protein CAPTEDRAFT_149947 [Capitella teleta]|uniref:Beta-catenin-like protein 1 n=1 Tax=Capitella teleta TaxID=283909 RepID=R7VIR3_CAPTE|nr:hypothetical protein CAPTEDRAFT_149947 [Capitella teleta]|eukprot:ELU18447.1 hypothetical protein CAPTEDRAFT_149947 [Capitella teleta]